MGACLETCTRTAGVICLRGYWSRKDSQTSSHLLLTKYRTVVLSTDPEISQFPWRLPAKSNPTYWSIGRPHYRCCIVHFLRLLQQPVGLTTGAVWHTFITTGAVWYTFITTGAVWYTFITYCTEQPVGLATGASWCCVYYTQVTIQNL